MSLIEVGKSTFRFPAHFFFLFVIETWLHYIVPKHGRLKLNSDLHSQTVCAAAAVLGCMTGITQHNSERTTLLSIATRLATSVQPTLLPMKLRIPKY
jgi:hypothetical protein